MSDAQQRAWTALSERLRHQLGATKVDRFIGGTHTQRFADNLVQGFPSWQIEALRTQLTRGAGNELVPTSSGKRRAHAPYSSAALAVNVFGRWLGSEAGLHVCGIGGFDQPISIEHKLKIAHGGGEANLDCVLQSPDLIVGIESKLTETLVPHEPVSWRAPYKTPEMAGLLCDRWADILRASLAGSWRPAFLGLEQLVKHALALSTHAAGRDACLVYCYWEPANGDSVDEVNAHRRELQRLQSALADATPTLHAITHHELLNEWEHLDPQPPWLIGHLTELRQRYELTL